MPSNQAPFRPYSKAEILEKLGIPEASWAKFWNNTTLQAIYAELISRDTRLMSSTYFSPTNFTKPGSIGLILLDESDFDWFGEKEQFEWNDDLHQCWAVKRMMDELKDVFPVFEGDAYSLKKIEVAITVIARVFRTCLGKKMEDIIVKEAVEA